MYCELCKKEFELKPEQAAVDGRFFCCEDHEKKWLKLYSKWLEAAYQKENYGNI